MTVITILVVIAILLLIADILIYKISVYLATTNWVSYYEEKAKQEEEEREKRASIMEELRKEREWEKNHKVSVLIRIVKRVTYVPGFSLEHPTLVDELENAQN